ncbi:hypothetical protein D9756_001914 [Leucocoprinus leucothites]|uniref:Uncharacterized protein n=1 Tax=Leucocoprinus leucothites TaxID=201217 RepID=A0A8H5G4C9_9AGAR|nr:hypothetical protein D9756_001914 [Leucoagaricus leucothites]
MAQRERLAHSTDAYRVLHTAEVSWKAEAIGATLQQALVDYKSWTPERIAVALKMQSLYPEKDWVKTFSPTFKNGDILASTNLQVLARILKESSLEDSEESIKSGGGSWKPQLHFVWHYLLERYLPGPDSTSPPKGSFQDFFRIVVDESLFSATSSPQRKYWGFQVFQKALSRIDEERMPMLFTGNFMRSWINHLSNRDNYLHKIAQQTATEVQTFVKQNPHLGFSLILQLTGVRGSQNFDKLTKTKTVGSILLSLDAEGIQKYIQWLFSHVEDFDASDSDGIQTINHKRQWTIEQLFALIRNGSIPKSDEWVQSVLDWLAVHGLFLAKKKSSKNPIAAARSVANPPFSDELRKSCRSRLLSCLSELNTSTTVLKTGEKATKVSAVASDGEFWVSKVLKTITALEADIKHVSALVEVDEEDQELRQRSLELVKKLRSVPEDQRETARGAELLLLATTLQHYCVDDPEEVDNDSLQTCIDGATRMFPEGGKKKKKKEFKNKAEDENEGVHEPVDVLVDTIIGFLEKATAYLKTTANQVFSLLSGSVKDSTIDLVLTQLERRDPTVEEEDDNGDIEMTGVESDEDGEEGVEETEDESDQSSAQEEEDEDEEDEDIDDEEALALRDKIEQALRVNGIEPATGDSDSEEELMDDGQMMAIDEQLAEVFRSRTNEKRSGKHDAQREATHFKIRVLDLVDTYVKKQSSNPLILRFISPLVDIMTGSSSDERQLLEKTKGIFSNRLAPKLNQLPSDISKSLVVKSYQDIHNYARRVRVPGLQSAFKQCSLNLTKCLLNLEAEDVVVDAYRASLTDFFTRKNSALQPVFFEDFLRQNRVVGWKLRQDILEGSDKALNGHRLSQAFQFIHVLLPAVSMAPALKSEWNAFLPALVAKILSTGHAACTEKATLNSVQLKTVLKLAVEALRLTQRQSPEALEETWNPDSWTSLKSELIECKRFENATGLHQTCDQIANAIKTPNTGPKTKQKKRKITDLQPVPAKRETKRKKVKGDA